MEFGLGLILSFTDNATSGIQGAVTSLDQLVSTANNASSSLNGLASLGAFSTIATRVGDSMVGAGTAIISTFSQVIGKVNQTGQTLMYAENQLNKLYEGSDRTGKQVLADISTYAKQSIFEFENLIPVVTMLKANGIEAFDTITSSSGKSAQTLMDYAADLAAFNPQMRNAYGTGIQAAMGALNEYISEGNARSLKSGASLDITGLLGEEKGATIEERSRQVADLLEQLNMVGMTATLASSPMTKLSNMSDTLFQFLGMVSNSGVYESFNNIISVFADFVNNIPEDRLKSIADVVGSALSSLLTPVQKLAEWIVKLSDAFLNFVETHPELAKFATQALAVSGALLVFGGVALKLLGSLGYLTMMVSQLGTSFGAIGGIMKAGAAKILGTMIPLTLKLGFLYFVWKNDIGGIRTTVQEFATNVSNSFNTAKSLVGGSLTDMQSALQTFDTKNNFFDGLTVAIMKLMVLGKALVEGWNSYTLSEDTFQKAQELGILPLIEAIFDLKYRFDNFKEGFIAGWQEIGNKIREFFSGIAKAAKGTPFESIFDGITKFFKMLTDNDPKAWFDAGKTFSKISAGIIAVWGAVKLFKGIGRIFGAGKSLGSALGSILGFGKKDKDSVLNQQGGILSSPVKALKTLGSIAILVGGIASLVVAVGALMSIPYFNEFMDTGISTLSKLFQNFIPLAGTIGGLGLLTKAFDVLKITPSTALKGIADFAILLGGMDVLITAMGALDSIPHFDDFLNTGVEVTEKLFNVLKSMFNLEVMGSIGAIALFGFLPISTAASGLANLAIVLGGMDGLITAFGALDSIPHFDDFLNTGIDVMDRLFGVLKSMFSLDIMGTIGAIALFGFVPVSTAALGLANLAIVLGGLDGLITAFGALDSIPHFDDFLNKGISVVGDLFNVLKSMFNLNVLGSIGAISLFGLVPVGVTVGGLANMGLILGGMTAIVEAFGALSQIPHFDEFLEKGGEVLSKVFTQLGSIVGSVVGGVGEGISNSLPTIGENLAGFSTNAEPFFNMASTVDTSNISTFITALSDLFGALTGDNIVSFFTGSGVDLANIGTQLSDFSTNASSFFTDVANIPDNAFTNMDSLFKSLNGIDNYAFKSGGLAQVFTGETSFDKIGEQLGSFSDKGLSFFDSVKDIPESGFTNASKLFEALAGLDATEFKSGGLVQWFSGEVAFDKIGEQLSNFSTKGADFFTAVKGLPEEGITNAASLFEALGGLSQQEFKSGGLLQALTGELSFDQVGSQLSSFATSGFDFFKSAKDLDNTSITNAGKVFDALKTINDLDFKSGGIAQWFSGEFDLSSVGQQLSDFSTNAEPFFTSAGSLDTTSLENGTKMLGLLNTLSENQGMITSIGTMGSGNWGAVGVIGTELANFASNAEGFFTAAKSYDEGTTAKAQSMLSVMNSVGSEINEGKGLKKLGENLSGFMTEGGSSFFTTIDSIGDATVTRASGIITAVSGLTETMSTINTGGFDMGNISQQLTDFATALTDFATKVGGDTTNLDGLTQMSTSITTFATSISTEGTNINTSLVGINTSFSNLITSLNSKLSEMTTNVGTKFSTMKTGVSTTISNMSTDIQTKFTSMATVIRSKVSEASTAVVQGFNTMKNTVSSASSSMSSSVSSSFSSISGTISSTMSSAVSTVTSSIAKMQSAFANAKFSIPQSHISLPHFSVSGSFSVNPPSVPSFSVSWYEQGAVFDKPSLIGVGENGSEAVMPLEKNTSWIGLLANQIVDNMGSSLTSSNLTGYQTNDNAYADNSGYIAPNNTSNTTYEGNTDNSVVFNAGAIQLICKDTSEEEARRLAKKIMEMIKRQGELDRMTSYA